MKNLKISKLLVLMLLMIMAIGTIFAQQGAGNQASKSGGGQMRHRKHRKPGALRQLDLTEAQRQQLRTIMTDKREKLQALKNDQTLTQEQKKERFRELNKATKEKMSGILTPEQKQKFESMKEKYGRMKGHRGKREGMAKSLNLTEAQQKQFKAINEESFKQISAIKNNNTLSKQDKMAKIKEIRQSSKTKMNAILTSEQQQKVSEMRQNRKQFRARKLDGQGTNCPNNGTPGQGKKMSK
jgi:Spy/CpxP family protein refolding chaperone